MRQLTLLRIVIKHTLNKWALQKHTYAWLRISCHNETRVGAETPSTTHHHPPTLSGEKLSPIHGPFFLVYLTTIKQGKLLMDLGVHPPSGTQFFHFTSIFTKKHPCQRLRPPPMGLPLEAMINRLPRCKIHTTLFR